MVERNARKKLLRDKIDVNLFESHTVCIQVVTQVLDKISNKQIFNVKTSFKLKYISFSVLVSK